MPAFQACPSCQTRLQAFYVKTSDGTQLLEVDGCRRCKGLWFDADELDKVLGQALHLERFDGETRRRCARCTKPMRVWLAPPGHPVERCDGCRGIFLDAQELSKLGAPGAEQKAQAELAGRVEFQCLKCQQHFPIREGNALGYGLACKGCTPMPGEDPLAKYVPDVDFSGDREALAARNRSDSSLASFALVVGLLDLFF